MATKIQWTNETWNPVVGCSKVSAGCLNCYAERMAYRLFCMGQEKYSEVVAIDSQETKIEYLGWNGKTYCDEPALEIPLHWHKPRRIFVCSMGDLFHKSVPFIFIDRVMDVIEEACQHDFQILTKKPEIMLEYFNGLGKRYKLSCCPNLWLGVTAENQEEADKRIPILLQIPAAVRFVSIEPMLGAVDLTMLDDPNEKICFVDGLTGNSINNLCQVPCYDGLDWVIVGGESGPGRRWCDNKWVRNVVEQCKSAEVPVFVKQLHSVHFNNPTVIKDINQFPEDLRIRQYPKGGE